MDQPTPPPTGLARLGACVAVHKTSTKGYRTLALLMLGSLTVGGGMLAGAAYGGPGDTGGRVVFAILGVLFLLPAAFGVYGLARGVGNAVRLYENGIVMRVAGVDRGASWDEIASYSDGAFLVVETKAGDTFGFGLIGLSRADQLFATLREQVVVRRLLVALQASIADGGSVELVGTDPDDAELVSEGFTQVGGFVVNAHGITPGDGAACAWGDVSDWGVTEGSAGRHTTVACAFVKGRGGSFQTPFERVSDRHLLLALCDRMCQRTAA